MDRRSIRGSVRRRRSRRPQRWASDPVRRAPPGCRGSGSGPGPGPRAGGDAEHAIASPPEPNAELDVLVEAREVPLVEAAELAEHTPANRERRAGHIVDHRLGVVLAAVVLSLPAVPAEAMLADHAAGRLQASIRVDQLASGGADVAP